MGNLQGNLAAGVRLQRLAITTVIPTLGILFGLLLAELLQTSAPEVARQARERSRIRLLVKPMFVPHWNYVVAGGWPYLPYLRATASIGFHRFSSLGFAVVRRRTGSPPLRWLDSVA